jgi:hypothetical protein
MKKSIIAILFLLCLFLIYSDSIHQIDVRIEKPETIKTIQLIYEINERFFLKNVEIVRIKETIFLYYKFELKTKDIINYGLLISGNYFMFGNMLDFDRIFYSDETTSDHIIRQYHKMFFETCKIYIGDYPITLKKIIIDDGRKRWEFYQDEKLQFALEDY